VKIQKSILVGMGNIIGAATLKTIGVNDKPVFK
jgi:hypothetical protein